MMEKRDWIMVGMGVIILALAVFIFSQEIQERIEIKEQELYNEGFNTARDQIIVRVIDAGLKCQQIPFTHRNVTMSFIAVNCLRQ